MKLLTVIKVLITLAMTTLASAGAYAQTPSSWRGVDNWATAIAVDLNGNVYAGGGFDMAGNRHVGSIGVWSPVTSQWSRLTSGAQDGSDGVPDGVGGNVDTIVTGPDGKVYVGGRFGTAGLTMSSGIATWDPVQTNWFGLAGGVSYGPSSFQSEVRALTFGNNKLYVFGSFNTAGGGAGVPSVLTTNVAAWDLTSHTWSMVGPEPPTLQVKSVITPDGVTFYAGGLSGLVKGTLSGSKFTWHIMDPNLTGSINSIVIGNNGKIYVAGQLILHAGDLVMQVPAAEWNGTRFVSLPNGYGSANSLVFLDDNNLVVGGGGFSTEIPIGSGVTAHNVAIFNTGTRTWSLLGTPTANGTVDGDINALAVAPRALLNVDIGTQFGQTQSPKNGAAAVGQLNGFWNYYTIFNGNSAVPNLKFAGGQPSSAGLVVVLGSDGDSNSSTDPMYKDYMMSFPANDGSYDGHMTLLVTNLPVGNYDFYLYGDDGNYQLTTSTDYGIKTCQDNPIVNPPAWQEGVQYAAFRNIPITSLGQTVTITIRPGARLTFGLHESKISGLQIIASPTVSNGTVYAAGTFTQVGDQQCATYVAGWSAPANSWFALADNASPTVSITRPGNGATFPAHGNLTISASAADDCTVTKVDFYQGATLLGTATSSPYSISWNNVPPGTYSLTAKATDNDGAVTTSSAIAIQAIGVPPTVSISSPANGDNFSRPANITINASASDSDGTVQKVDFYQGSTLLGTDLTAPYSFSWINVPRGPTR